MILLRINLILRQVVLMELMMLKLSLLMIL